MINMPPNVILWVCVALVGSIVGFVIYGLIKGFDHLFKEE